MVGVPGRTSSVIRSSRIMAITIPARSDVLLNAAIDNTIFAYINRLGKETGGYICHKCFALCI